jgi:hypothetical protein
MPSNKNFRSEIASQLSYFLPPVMVTMFLWLTRASDVTFLQSFIACALLYSSWRAFRVWVKGNRDSIPLFSMMSFMFWLYYVLPLFWGSNDNLDFATIGQNIATEEGITEALLMTLIGVLAIWLGMKSGIGRFLIPKHFPDIHPDSARWSYLRLLLVIGTVGSIYDNAPYVLGEGGRQIILICLTFAPTVVFAILFRNFLKGNSKRVDVILLIIFTGVRLLTGLASGWMGPVVMILIICVATYVTERKSIPRLAVILLVCYILFLQPGKGAVRAKYWYGEEDASKIEKINFWIDSSAEQWINALSEPTGESIRNLGYQSLSRTSLLTQTANVVQLTPSVVPYQYGRLYSYMAVTLIPRFVWPDKPSMNEANQFYQVAYGLTTEDNLNKVSISVGFLTESYINFGWLGVFLVMFLIGMGLDVYLNIFLSENSGLLFRGIGLALLPQFLSIESQAAQFLAGIIQQVFLTLIILLPIISQKSYVVNKLSVKSLFPRK